MKIGDVLLWLCGTFLNTALLHYLFLDLIPGKGYLGVEEHSKLQSVSLRGSDSVNVWAYIPHWYETSDKLLISLYPQ